MLMMPPDHAVPPVVPESKLRTAPCVGCGVGASVGDLLGAIDGAKVVGLAVGDLLGLLVEGLAVGDVDGVCVGAADGARVGKWLGFTVGL